MVQDHAGKGGRQHQDQQPRHTGFPRVEYTGAEIGLVGGQHSGHLLEVLGGLLLDNVHSVVDGDDTHQPLLQIHNGHGEEVVLAQRLSHVLLIVGGLGPHHVRIHDILDEIVLVRQQQVADGQHAQQAAGGIGDVQDVDGLQLAADAADALEGVRHRHILLQGQEFHVHDGTGAVLRVFQNFIDRLAHLRRGLIQNADHHAGGHLLHDVHGVVQIQLVQHFLQLGVGKAVDEHLLTLALQLHEYLRRRLLGQQPVQQRHDLRPGLFQDLGNIRTLHGQEHVTQVGIAFLPDHLPDLVQQCIHFVFQIDHAAFLLSMVRPLLRAQKNTPARQALR